MSFILYQNKLLAKAGKLIVGDSSCCCTTTIPCINSTIYGGFEGKWPPEVSVCMCKTDWEPFWEGAISQVMDFNNCYSQAISSVLEFYTKAGYEIVSSGGAYADTSVEACQKSMADNNISCPNPGSLECNTTWDENNNPSGTCEDCVSCAPYGEASIMVKCCKTKLCSEIQLNADQDDGLYHYIDNMEPVEICKAGGPIPSLEINGKYYPDIKIPPCCKPDPA